jgi:Tfp pilus assembly protein PilF
MRFLGILFIIAACSAGQKTEEQFQGKPANAAKTGRKQLVILNPVEDWKVMFTPRPTNGEKKLIAQKLAKWKSSGSVNEIIQKSRLESTLGRTKTSENTLKSGLRDFPNSQDIKLELALVLNKRGDTEGSFALLSEIRGELDEATYPDKGFVFKYRYCLGLAYLEKKDISKGQEIMSQLVGTDATFAPAYVALALSYLSSGKVEAADFVAKRGLERAGPSSSILNLLGTISRTQGKLDEALEWFGKAIQSDSTYVPAIVNRAAISLEKGDLDLAGKEVSKALEIDPEHIDALSLSAVTHIQKGNFAVAKSLLQRVIELDQNNIDARFNLALIQEKTSGDTTDLRRLYGEVVQLAPVTSSVYERASQRLSELRGNGKYL